MDLAAEMDMELETDERGLAEPPAPHDIKQKWIDYAVLCGENPDTARDMTKADLMSKYGGRL
jgi:hypothetical protein